MRLLTTQALATRWLPADVMRQYAGQLVLDAGFAAAAPLSRLDLPFPDYTGLVCVRNRHVVAFKPFNVGSCAAVLAQIPAQVRP